MKILHYALGFPPYRSGGLTKYCVDLMVQQAKEGHDVSMLWPGTMKIFSKKTFIKRRGDVYLQHFYIKNFEIINPLPVSYDEGIVEFLEFMKDVGVEPYEKLLENFQPDIIHIHTLMGIHKGFFDAAKERNIRVVFTAHDFFPICPKVTLFYKGKICSRAKSCENCAECNSAALSLTKIKILQSPLYRKMKDNCLVKRMRKLHRDSFQKDDNINHSLKNMRDAVDYIKLREYYYSLLKNADIIHYNSSVTKEVYESYFDFPNSCVISITHLDIHDKRKIKKFSKDILHIRYLGAQSGAKGFFLLQKALDKMWDHQQNFCLDIHFLPIKNSRYIREHSRYVYGDLEEIFEKTDILVAPSIWYETFGFTVLEALSYGVPVIISGTVGAKDILVDGAGIVVENISSENLCEVFQKITVGNLEKMNKVIVEKQTIMEIQDMSRQIEKQCYEWQMKED